MGRLSLTNRSVSIYGRDFFEKINPDSLQSANVIVTILMDILHPQSVVDIGCGTGSWLSVFKKSGVNKILGIDGIYVGMMPHQIDKDEFISLDLRKPFTLPETFDLALCLEVAEHLPPRSAHNLVNSLVGISQVILFSAAVPGQGGVHHVNEQWPEYWEKLFSEADYTLLDPIRPLIWQDPRVAWYYRQNCLLFVKRSWVETNDTLKYLATNNTQNDMLYIHKRVLAANLSLIYSLKRIPGLAISILFRYLMRRKY
jgi:SAM-dependent methyltransferase